MKIYVASSWRNDYQQNVVSLLREYNHEVYDFKNPPGKKGFSWSSIDPLWKNWTPSEYRKHLYGNSIAQVGFEMDFLNMNWADCCVLVLPCGASAHAEAGWMKGNGKSVIAFIPTFGEKNEPELMYRLFDYIAVSVDDLINHIGNGNP